MPAGTMIPLQRIQKKGISAGAVIAPVQMKGQIEVHAAMRLHEQVGEPWSNGLMI